MQQIAYYQIKELLGKGSFASVYRAFDEKFERYVALKILSPVWLRDPQAVARFTQEAKTMAKLRHPHIVDVYDIGEAEGHIYLAQFLVEGETLAAKLNGAPISWQETLTITDQIAQALDYAHNTGIVHRDIKPSNILLDRNGSAYLGDFGLVRAAEGSVVLSSSAAGGIIGTPAYMAPEQWEAHEVTSATDVYALSCVVVEMLTGKILFDGPTPAFVMKRHLINGPEFPEAWPDDVPPGLTEVLQSGLKEDAAKRIQKAGELTQAMASLNLLTTPITAAGTEALVSTKVETPSFPIPVEDKASDNEILIPVETAPEKPVAAPEIVSSGETKPATETGLKTISTPTELEETAQVIEITPNRKLEDTPKVKPEGLQLPGKVEGRRKVPLWVWGGVGTIVLLLIVWGMFMSTGGVGNPSATATKPPTTDETQGIVQITQTPTPSPTPQPTSTPRPTDTSTPKPTSTPRPTNTPTPKPTSTSRPTNTPTPRPTSTPRPSPTSTIPPTNTLIPPSPTPPPAPEPTSTPTPGFSAPEGRSLYVFHNNTPQDMNIDIGPYFLQVPSGQVGQIPIDPGTYKWKATTVDGQRRVMNPQSGGIEFEINVALGEVYETGARW